MTNGRPYWQKLRDPRWQRKRLHIMERDGFSCQSCAVTEKTLNVHHIVYTSGAEPWESPDDDLITLCEGCHDRIENQLKAIRRAGADNTGLLTGIFSLCQMATNDGIDDGLARIVDSFTLLHFKSVRLADGEILRIARMGDQEIADTVRHVADWLHSALVSRRENSL